MIALYHGTTMEVPSPLVKLGRKRVDFGQGFYLTKLRRRASLWAETMAERRISGFPVLNEYWFDNDLAKELAGTRYKVFSSEQALGQLAYKEVNHQIAMLSQRILDACLKFKGAARMKSKGSRRAR